MCKCKRNTTTFRLGGEGARGGSKGFPERSVNARYVTYIGSERSCCFWCKFGHVAIASDLQFVLFLNGGRLGWHTQRRGLLSTDLGGKRLGFFGCYFSRIVQLQRFSRFNRCASINANVAFVKLRSWPRSLICASRLLQNGAR